MSPRALRAKLRSALAIALAGAGGASACGASEPSEAPSDASPANADEASACAPEIVDAAITDGCADLVRFPCGLPADAASSGCALWAAFCNAACPSPAFLGCDVYEGCVDGAIARGPAVLACDKCIGDLGRPPAALAPAACARDPRDAGDHFAEAARLERASARAFRDLARRLASHGAPRSLVNACRRAARDERRHAVVTRRLARRHGARVEAPRVAPFAAMDLEALVTDNATAGCVREGFAALIALHQAARAEGPVARAHARIAADETRHAALAWSVHRWGTARLSPDARARVADAQRRALIALRAEARVAWPASIQRAAGLPDAGTAQRLARAFTAMIA